MQAMSVICRPCPLYAGHVCYMQAMSVTYVRRLIFFYQETVRNNADLLKNF